MPCVTCLLESVCHPECREASSAGEVYPSRCEATPEPQPIEMPAGTVLYREGAGVESFFLIRRGTFKSGCVAGDGAISTARFHFARDMVGLEAVALDYYPYQSIALEASEGLLFPYAKFMRSSRLMPQVRACLYRVLNADAWRNASLRAQLNVLDPPRRVAQFLQYLRQRREDGNGALALPIEDVAYYLHLPCGVVSDLMAQMTDVVPTPWRVSHSSRSGETRGSSRCPI